VSKLGVNSVFISDYLYDLEPREKTAILTAALLGDMTAEETKDLCFAARTGSALKDMRWVEFKSSNKRRTDIRRVNEIGIKSTVYNASVSSFVFVHYGLFTMPDITNIVESYYKCLSSSKIEYLFARSNDTQRTYKNKSVQIPSLLMLNNKVSGIQKLCSEIYSASDLTVFRLAMLLEDKHKYLIPFEQWGSVDHDVIYFVTACMLLYEDVPIDFDQAMMDYLNYKHNTQKSIDDESTREKKYKEALKTICYKPIARGEPKYAYDEMTKIGLTQRCGYYVYKSKMIFVANIPNNPLSKDDIIFGDKHYMERNKIWCYNNPKREVGYPSQLTGLWSMFSSNKTFVIPKYLFVNGDVLNKSALTNEINSFVYQSFENIVSACGRMLEELIDKSSMRQIYTIEYHYILMAILLGVRIDFIISNRGSIDPRYTGMTLEELYEADRNDYNELQLNKNAMLGFTFGDDDYNTQ
jgi:hypothetical protein